METYKNDRFHLVFCDATDGLFPSESLSSFAYPFDSRSNVYKLVRKEVQVESLVLLKQTHSSHGVCVNSENRELLSVSPRHEGDFLYTSLPGVGLGVLTADCLPIALYDPVHNVAAMVHAGWRGTVEDISKKTLNSMHATFGTRPEDVEVFLGPCAKACCYKVGDDFAEKLSSFSWTKKVLERRKTGIYFNVPLCNLLLLQESGVRHEAISLAFNHCTLCNSSFCSHRRDADTSCRQLSLIVVS